MELDEWVKVSISQGSALQHVLDLVLCAVSAVVLSSDSWCPYFCLFSSPFWSPDPCLNSQLSFYLAVQITILMLWSQAWIIKWKGKLRSSFYSFSRSGKGNTERKLNKQAFTKTPGLAISLVMVTRRSLMKTKYEETLSRSCSIWSQNMHRRVMVPGADQVWHKKLVVLVSQLLTGLKTEPSRGLSHIQKLVNENYQVHSLFPSDHLDTGIFFPETETQTKPECACVDRGKYSYQHHHLEGFQKHSPCWRQMLQATECNKTVLTQGLQH